MNSVFFNIDNKHTIVLQKTKDSWNVRWIYESLDVVKSKLSNPDVYENIFESYSCFMHIAYDNFTFEDMKFFLEEDEKCNFIKCREEIAYHIRELSR